MSFHSNHWPRFRCSSRDIPGHLSITSWPERRLQGPPDLRNAWQHRSQKPWDPHGFLYWIRSHRSAPTDLPWWNVRFLIGWDWGPITRNIEGLWDGSLMISGYIRHHLNPERATNYNLKRVMTWRSSWKYPTFITILYILYPPYLLVDQFLNPPIDGTVVPLPLPGALRLQGAWDRSVAAHGDRQTWDFFLQMERNGNERSPWITWIDGMNWWHL